MNIRVDLNTPINDGTEVVFRSPVDCSQVTGLIVYYDGGSQEFMFADAHGYNVGNIDHLFAENVVVKVILDVTTSMAFVQNADTNAYLEWRFKDTIDKLAPSFTESGSVVSCNPVEGYPLSIVSHIEPVQAGSGDPSPVHASAHKQRAVHVCDQNGNAVRIDGQRLQDLGSRMLVLLHKPSKRDVLLIIFVYVSIRGCCGIGDQLGLDLLGISVDDIADDHDQQHKADHNDQHKRRYILQKQTLKHRFLPQASSSNL